ncbi:hypothetical protein RZN25_12140 [Bacillaceae bacterium S4-13-56]
MKKLIMFMSILFLLFLVACSEEEKEDGLLDNIPEKYINGPNEDYFYGPDLEHFNLTDEEKKFIEENVPHMVNQKNLLLEVYNRYYDKELSSYTLEEIDNLLQRSQVYQIGPQQESILDVRPEIGFMISAGSNVHYLLVQLKEQKFLDKFQEEGQSEYYFGSRPINEIIDQVMYQYVIQVKPIVKVLEEKENE